MYLDVKERPSNKSWARYFVNFSLDMGSQLFDSVLVASSGLRLSVQKKRRESWRKALNEIEQSLTPRGGAQHFGLTPFPRLSARFPIFFNVPQARTTGTGGGKANEIQKTSGTVISQPQHCP